jgi:hypothetical protein
LQELSPAFTTIIPDKPRALLSHGAPLVAMISITNFGEIRTP